MVEAPYASLAKGGNVLKGRIKGEDGKTCLMGIYGRDCDFPE